MSDALPHTGHAIDAALTPAAEPDAKALDLAILKRGAKDFLTFVDDTKELFYSYLYHRLGSSSLAATVMTELYLEILGRAMSLWWFGSLSLKMLLAEADHAIAAGVKAEAADIDKQYVPSMTGLSDAERKAIGTLHETLWTLPVREQQLLTLSVLVGLSDDRIAAILYENVEPLKAEIIRAKETLVARWQPPASLRKQLSSLVFEPSLDISFESDLRFKIVEKYNAMRLRRYQWVVVGGLIAVMSNLIVASVLAFAVVSMPSTSIQSVNQELAGLDALILKRNLESAEVRRSLGGSYNTVRGMGAHNALPDINALGVSAAAETVKAQTDAEKKIQNTIDLLKRASEAGTAFIPGPHPLLSLAIQSMPSMVSF